MKPIKGVLTLIAAFLMFCFVVGQARGQSVTYRDTLLPVKYPVVTISKTDTVRVVVHDTVYVSVPCDSTPNDTVVPPDPSFTMKALYVSPIADWLDNANARLSWAKREGVNTLLLYARAYVTSSSNHSKLAAFVAKSREYGIKKVYVDYRLTSEIPGWKSYNDKYKGTPSALDGMVTEREPYVTGDYAGFWPFLREGKAFAKANGLDLAVYMGHPTQQGWDSIVFYADRVFLSLYITMSTWNNSTNGYNYARGRWEYISNSCKAQGKKDYPVLYITSLERKVWGANNDFMGERYMTNSFFGSTWDILQSQYNSNATPAIKEATDLVGKVIFYSKYGLLARP